MVIPERTRRVHKVVVPFFLLKLGVILFSLSAVFLIIMGIDYVHVLGRMAENKRLKGENFKLRQEIQLVRNKVDAMEMTIERVRNYAKKLQILTGQSERAGNEIPFGGGPEEDVSREPATPSSPSSTLKERRSSLTLPPDSDNAPDGGADSTPPVAPSGLSLNDRVEKLETVSLSTETNLSRLQVYLIAQSAVMAATPSLLPTLLYLQSLQHVIYKTTKCSIYHYFSFYSCAINSSATNNSGSWTNK